MPRGNGQGVNVMTFGNTPYNNPLRRLAHFFAAVILMCE
jgi:hypothetical protein